jgi:hypothetical protein
MVDNPFMRMLMAAGLIYCVFLIVLFIFQRNFFYFPTKTESYNIENLKGPDAKIMSAQNIRWILLKPENDRGKILVYFHGNAGMALHRLWKASAWVDFGYHVVLVEYPGYGMNKGSPSEQAFYISGRVVIDKTISDFPDSDLYIYGESIGSGTAVQMATEYDEKALIIESGFSSLTDVAFSKMPFVPVPFLIRDRFENDRKINDINSKLVMIHGDQDSIIPIHFGEKLYNTYKGQKVFYKIDGAGHNNIYESTDISAIIQDMT